MNIYRFIKVLLFLAITFVIFGQSLFHDFAPIDDSFVVVNNLAIRGFSWENIKQAFTTFDPELYIPFTLLSFQFDYTLWGLNPFGFHLTNLILHALNGLLVMWVMTFFFSRRWIPFLLGLLFLVHPLNTEAVVWITGRKDLLSTSFFLLSLGFFMKREGKAYLLSLLFFLFALLTKVNTVTLIGVLFLISWYRGGNIRSIITKLLPYIVLGAVFMVVAAVGKERILGESAPLETLLLTGKTTLFYLQKFLLPLYLSVFYPQYDSISFVSPGIFVPLLILAGLLVWSVKSFLHRRIVATGVLIFIVTLLPTYLNAHKGAVTFFAVDRYMYVPMIGLLLIVGIVLQKLFERVDKKPMLVTSAVILVCFSGISIAQVSVWSTPERLFSHVLGLYPESLNARLDLSRIHREQGDIETAFRILQEGQQYEKHEPYLLLHSGFLYARVGQVADARAQFRASAKLIPDNPEPIFALGSLEEQVGKVHLAKPLYEQAVEMDPSYVVARIRLGKIYLLEDRKDEARTQFEEALKWNPNSVEARRILQDVVSN